MELWSSLIATSRITAIRTWHLVIRVYQPTYCTPSMDLWRCEISFTNYMHVFESCAWSQISQFNHMTSKVLYASYSKYVWYTIYSIWFPDNVYIHISSSSLGHIYLQKKLTYCWFINYKYYTQKWHIYLIVEHIAIWCDVGKRLMNLWLLCARPNYTSKTVYAYDTPTDKISVTNWIWYVKTNDYVELTVN